MRKSVIKAILKDKQAFAKKCAQHKKWFQPSQNFVRDNGNEYQ
jgi:hypothetical protein